MSESDKDKYKIARAEAQARIDKFQSDARVEAEAQARIDKLQSDDRTRTRTRARAQRNKRFEMNQTNLEGRKLNGTDPPPPPSPSPSPPPPPPPPPPPEDGSTNLTETIYEKKTLIKDALEIINKRLGLLTNEKEIPDDQDKTDKRSLNNIIEQINTLNTTSGQYFGLTPIDKSLDTEVKKLKKIVKDITTTNGATKNNLSDIKESLQKYLNTDTAIVNENTKIDVPISSDSALLKENGELKKKLAEKKLDDLTNNPLGSGSPPGEKICRVTCSEPSASGGRTHYRFHRTTHKGRRFRSRSRTRQGVSRRCKNTSKRKGKRKGKRNSNRNSKKNSKNKPRRRTMRGG